MNTLVTVEPWPMYSDSGAGPSWNVRISTRGKSVALVWSTRLGRFVTSWSKMNLRRGNPGAYRAAVEFMRRFSGVTVTQQSVTEKSESVTSESVTVSRAPADPKGLCHGVTAVTVTHPTVTAQRDSDTQAPDGPGVTITPGSAEAKRDEQRRRLAADPRFAGWVAGSAR